jgi:succinyl-diaminopimelate desuccinylase
MNRIDIEKNIDVDYVKEILKELIKIQSINPPQGDGERKAAEYLIHEMKKLHLDIELEEIAPGRNNAVGVLKGIKSGSVLALNGHLDVVPANANEWQTNPFEAIIENGRVFGRGVVDMKGALASMMGAIKYLIDYKLKINGQLILSFVCDEESGINLGTKNFLKRHPKLDYAIIGEPTGLKIAVAHRGVLRFKITTLGRSGHASEPDKAVNAIYKMRRILEKIEIYNQQLSLRKHKILPPPTIAVSIIKGGTIANVIPNECEITADRRLIPGETKETAYNELKRILEEIKREEQDFNYHLEIKEYVCPGELKSDSQFLKNISDIYCNYFEVETPPIIGFKASNEQVLFLEEGVDTIVIGPGDIGLAHAKNENIEFSELVCAAGFYAYSVLNLLN